MPVGSCTKTLIKLNAISSLFFSLKFNTGPAKEYNANIYLFALCLIYYV